MLHELLQWLSQEHLAKDGLYCAVIIVIVAILKFGTEGIIDFFWFFRKGKNEKTNRVSRGSDDVNGL